MDLHRIRTTSWQYLTLTLTTICLIPNLALSSYLPSKLKKNPETAEVAVHSQMFNKKHRLSIVTEDILLKSIGQ